MKAINLIKDILFGIRVSGENLQIPQPIREREFNAQDFQEWCQEFHVSMLHGKMVTYF